MGQKKPIFRQIDEFVFQKVDLIKNDSSFQQLLESFTSLSEKEQQIVAQSLAIGVIVIPYLFVLYLAWSNYSIRQRITAKNQIIEQASLFESNQNALNDIGPETVSDYGLQSASDLQGKLAQLGSPVVEASKISVRNFNILNSTHYFQKVEGTVHFEKFGTQDFSHFMTGLTDREKFKIGKIDLKTNKETRLLEGDIQVIHVGRNAQL